VRCDGSAVDPVTKKEKKMTEQQEHIEQFFKYDHLPEKLQAVSAPFGQLAHNLRDNMIQQHENDEYKIDRAYMREGRVFLESFENNPRFIMPDYFDFYNEELSETSREFYYEGILKPPFDNCIIDTKYIEDENDGCPNINLRICVQHQNDYTRILFFVAALGTKEYEMMPFIIDVKGDKSRLTPMTPLVAENIRVFTAWALKITLLCFLVISMPQFEHTEVDRGEKLQRAREKNGKPPLGRLIQLKLRPELRAMCDSDGESGVIRRPHWRRGHLRRLSSGKITPVSPCMVNFNGEVVEPKTYKVRN
jgi:hypothetical protein